MSRYKKNPAEAGGGKCLYFSFSTSAVPGAPAGQDGGNEAGKWNTDSGCVNRIYLTHLIKPININDNDAVFGQQ